MSTDTRSAQPAGSAGARPWIGVLAAAAAVLVILRATSGALTVLLVIIVLALLLESHLNRRSPSVPHRR